MSDSCHRRAIRNGGWRAQWPDVLDRFVNNSSVPKWAYWEAIRRDLDANAVSLAALRRALAVSDWEYARHAAERLTDLRLIDICAWTPGPEIEGEA